MTQAVCFKCGVIKFGAFVPCPDCGARPQTEEDLVMAMAMTDHYFDLPTLEQFGAELRAGRPPELAPENRAKLIELIRSTNMVHMVQQVSVEPENTVSTPLKPVIRRFREVFQEEAARSGK